MPKRVHDVAWIVMSAGYSYSGLTKLASPSWRDGSALVYVLANPLARPNALRDLVQSWPPPVLTGATWAALTLELLFAPLALVARARPWLWLAMAAMHVGLLLLIDLADLSVGMLMLHLFTFDPTWIRRREWAGVGRLLARSAAALLLVSASSFPRAASAGVGEAGLNADLPRFREQVQSALALRAETVRFAAELRARHEEGKPLTGRQVEQIRTGTAQHLALRDDLLEFIRRYEPWIDAEATPLLPEEVRLKGVMVSLTGALVLYDNFAASVLLFEQQHRLTSTSTSSPPSGSSAPSWSTWSIPTFRGRAARSSVARSSARITWPRWRSLAAPSIWCASTTMASASGTMQSRYSRAW
jgi:hypothetical protein